MKKKNFYKKALTTLFLLLITVTAFAQNPYHQKSNDEIEAQAVTITRKYDEQLGLTAKQEMLFKIKVAEYLINEQKIRNSNLSIKQKFRAIRKNSRRETADMGDILTRIQYRLYKKVKPEFQPVRPIIVGEVSEK